MQRGLSIESVLRARSRLRGWQLHLRFAVVLCLLPCSLRARAEGALVFPRAFAVATDDLGWNEGGSLGERGGPWRVGFRRRFDVRDYRPLVEVGRAVGVRLQGLFVLAEMDRAAVCASCPTSTQAGRRWDNRANASPRQLEVMSYVRDNAAHLELGLHGVGHEHWVDGKRTRAEWYDQEHDRPRPEEDVRSHLRCFREIMAQYGLTRANGQSFPESFVPCSYAYHYNPGGASSTGKLMREQGVKYVNTNFKFIPELKPPTEAGGGFDHGVLVLDRKTYGNEWHQPAAVPSGPIESFATDVIEAHWANWLATDDFLQPALNQRWVAFYRKVQARPDRYLAKNTEQLYSQWLYKRFTSVEEQRSGKLRIDNRRMPAAAYEHGLLGNMVLKLRLKPGEHVAQARLDGGPVAAIHELAGQGQIYLPPLERRVYELVYATGKSPMTPAVVNEGTYNVYRLSAQGDTLRLDVKMYGTQVVHVRGPQRVLSAHGSNPNLKILGHGYNAARGLYELTLVGRDIQGERGELRLRYR